MDASAGRKESQHTLQQRVQVSLHQLEGCTHIVEALALQTSQAPLGVAWQADTSIVPVC